MQRTDKCSQHSSIIWTFWLIGWVFVYELSGCGFESRWFVVDLYIVVLYDQNWIRLEWNKLIDKISYIIKIWLLVSKTFKQPTRFVMYKKHSKIDTNLLIKNSLDGSLVKNWSVSVLWKMWVSWWKSGRKLVVDGW